MTTSTINNTLRDLIFENINDKYSWGNYGEFKVLMMRENGYINVTKLCKEGGKEFRFWRRLDMADNLIKETSSDGHRCTSDILITINGGNQTLLTRGTYAHPDLVPHIASWVSPSFAIKVSRIVNEYFVREEKEKILRLEFEKSDLMKSLDTERRKSDEERRESEHKAEQARLAFDRKFDEQCRKSDEEYRKADEERRKADERYQDMCKRYGFQEERLEATEDKLDVANEKMDVANEKMDVANEKMDVANERLGHVEEKLGIAREIVVPKEQNKDYHEMFTLLKRTKYDSKKDYEYYAICGQVKYVKKTRSLRIASQGMVEVLPPEGPRSGQFRVQSKYEEHPSPHEGTVGRVD
jgi:hypothetical protein